MKQLTALENLLFRVGAIMIISGLAVHLLSEVASLFLFGIGVLLFTLMQLRAEYLGSDGSAVLSTMLHACF